MDVTRSPDAAHPGGFDVVVLGSGSAGLSAALTAASAGLSTVVVEKTSWIGGTTAYSGAGTWVPGNHHAKEAGIADGAEDALTYLRATAPEGWIDTEDALWRSFSENAAPMLALLEAKSPLRFELIAQPDTFLEAPGSRPFGRMVSPKLLRLKMLGSWAKRLRGSKLPQLFTYAEMLKQDPRNAPPAQWLALGVKAFYRLARGDRGLGTALVAGLLKGCLDHGCQVRLASRATALMQDEHGRITGVRIEHAGTSTFLTARHGVIIATGGFEWDAERLSQHFAGAVDLLASPRANSGDGHRMAEAAGAALARMDQANINGAIPGFYEGGVQGLGWFHHRAPNVILVDARGRRFVDEFSANLGEVLDARDPVTGQPIHLPAWLIADAAFLRREWLARWFARHDKTWLRRARTVADLARSLGVEPEALTSSVNRFNDHCAHLKDPDFGRGDNMENKGQAFEPISRAPFVAVPFNRSFMSTKGGPRTDADACVLRRDGSVIDGLYCAGVAMANPIGTRGVGAGTTIGPNLTWGYIAARHIFSRASAPASPVPANIKGLLS